MSLRSRRFLRLMLPVLAVMCLAAAPQQQLSPTVSVVPGVTTPLPPECEQGLAPQPQPRATTEEKIAASEATAPPAVQPPPSKDLRATLTDVQTAAERNERAAFVDALARAKSLVATYPTGGERTAAEKAIAVYDDLDRLWASQLTPSGAFFDSSSDSYKMLSRYPGYDDFVREQVLVDRNGTKFYPSAESRRFLTQIAAARLKDLGVRTTTAEVATPAAPAVRPQEKPVAVAVPAPTAERHAEPVVPRHAEKRATTTATHKPKRTTARAEAKPAAPKKAVEAAPPRKPARVETVATTSRETKVAAPAAPAMKAAPLTTTSAKTSTTAVTAPAVSATSPAPSTSAAPPTATAATATTSSAPAETGTATATTASAASDTGATETATAAPAEKAQSGKAGEPRNLIWPIILIVVGVGVLILLFRTSPEGK